MKMSKVQSHCTIKKKMVFTNKLMSLNQIIKIQNFIVINNLLKVIVNSSFLNNFPKINKKKIKNKPLKIKIKFN